MPTDLQLTELQERIGHRFRSPALLLEALTHGSYLQDQPASVPHNQRLEFLGDSVLQFIITDALFAEFTSEREGVLSRRRAVLSKGEFLTRMAHDLGIDVCLRLSRSEEETGGRTRASILEDAFEALVAALYLDTDLATTKRLVLGWYGPLASRLENSEEAENPKGRLQELVQPKHGNTALRYEVIETSGPRHARSYEVAVLLLNERIGTGSGSSKKAAEEEAARTGLEWLKRRNPPPASP